MPIIEQLKISCKNCTRGRYQNEFAFEDCYTCPVGWEQPQRSALECSPCKAGQFARNEESRQCDNCYKGQYQDEIGQTCKNCPPGQYQDKEGQKIGDAPWVYVPCAIGKFTACEGFDFAGSAPMGRRQSSLAPWKCHENHRNDPATYRRVKGEEARRQHPCIEWDFPQDASYFMYNSCPRASCRHIIPEPLGPLDRTSVEDCEGEDVTSECMWTPFPARHQMRNVRIS